MNRWNNWGIIVGVIGIVLTIALPVGEWITSRDSVELEVRITATVALAAPTDSLSDRIEVRFDGSRVEQLWLSTFRVANSGDKDVGEADFGGAVKFTLQKDVVKEITVGESSPPGIPFEVFMVSGNEFDMKPLLLKKGEHVTFSVLSTEKLEEPTVSGRIKDGEISTRTLAEESRDELTVFLRILWATTGALASADLYILAMIFKSFSARRKRMKTASEADALRKTNTQ